MHDAPPLEDLARRAAGAADLLRLLANERRLQILCVPGCLSSAVARAARNAQYAAHGGDSFDSHMA